jgi:phage shock protein A
MNNAGAPGVSGNQDAAKLAELESLSRSNRIKERLARIKSES